MPTVSNWNQLQTLIKNKVTESLNNEVYEAVKNTMQEHIESDVYGAYSPTSYERRGSGGGLSDDGNIIKEMPSDMELEVMNITSANESMFGHAYSPPGRTTFAEWIDRGEVYDFNGSGSAWSQERPFLENTVLDLSQNKQHVGALKEGLAKRGIKAE